VTIQCDSLVLDYVRKAEFLLWLIDPLLGNYGETSNETIASALQQLRKYTTVLKPLLDSGPRTTVELLLEAVFSMWSVRRLYHSTDQVGFWTDRGLSYSAKARITIIICRMRDTYTRKRPSIFIRDKPILSAEMMLYNDYGCKGSAEKEISGSDPEGAWRQDEVIGCKPPVVK
jgi:hypothetical protein